MDKRKKNRIKLGIVLSLLLIISYLVQSDNKVVPMSQELAKEDGGSREIVEAIKEEKEDKEIEDEEKKQEEGEEETKKDQEDQDQKTKEDKKDEKSDQDKLSEEEKIKKEGKASKKEEVKNKVDKEYTKEDIEEIKEEQKKEKEKIIASDSKKPKDKYLTDPTPAGKPKPVEWQDVKIDKTKPKKATLSVSCHSILNNMHLFNMDKIDVLPESGVIYGTKEVTFYEGESVFNVLLREMQEAGIHMEFEMTPIYNSHYIQGINNLYEFDCGELSGWMYRVNGWFPNYGASRYMLKDGDKIEWIYTCDLGRDIGGGAAVLGGE